MGTCTNVGLCSLSVSHSMVQVACKRANVGHPEGQVVCRRLSVGHPEGQVREGV
jgi:hypothetical protein